MSQTYTSAKSPGNQRPETFRLPNLLKLYHVPVFALRELLKERAPGHKFGSMRQAELIAEADKLAVIGQEDVERLYENYRYGRSLSFQLYLLPSGLKEPAIAAFQKALDEWADAEVDLEAEAAAGEDYEGESAPSQLVLLDEEKLDGIREIRFRYFVTYRYLDAEEQPAEVLQTRYGFLWLDLALGYLAILARDERVNYLVTRALSNCLQSIPVPVRFTEDLVDKHFSLEKIKRVSHYDPGTGVRQSISGQDLWRKFEHEIRAREERYVRPSSLYDEEIAEGVISGLGVVSTKGKIYFTRTLPTSLVRAWGIQRLPELVRDAKNLREEEEPVYFTSSVDAINRMRLPAAGKAAITDIAEALLKSEREGVMSVDLPRTGLQIYKDLRGRYFTPYLRVQCSECEETAELCPFCEGQDLQVKGNQVMCKTCGATVSDENVVALRCMNSHVTVVPRDQAFSIAPNHWLQKRMTRIFAEIGQSWHEHTDYFHIEGSTLYRLRRDQIDKGGLPPVVQTYINNFWDPVTGQIHSGSGDILTAGPNGHGRDTAADGRSGADVPAGALQGYKDFDLRLRGSLREGYTVEAAVSGGGSAPPQPLILPQGGAFGQRLRAVLYRTADAKDIRWLGEALFNALFPTRVLKLWTRTLGGLANNEGLRLRLHISPPELTILPWELLFEEEYVGLRLRFPIVRYLDLPDPPRPLTVRPPLRVLVAVAQPRDLYRVDVQTEIANMRKALSYISGQVKMDVLQPVLRGELLDRLRKGYHVLHYVGHGAFDKGRGYLLLEDEGGRSDPVSAALLGQIVSDSDLRLVVLNACETSRTAGNGTFGSMAHQLVRSGLPAVVAMQQHVNDALAVAFGRGFYGALANAWPVDAAVQEGRRGIMAALGNNWQGRIDWAIPTLYMRAPDGIILGLREQPSSSKAQEVTRSASHSTQFHGPVYGPAHSGSGSIQVDHLKYGVDVRDLDELFDVLHQQVEEQAPPDKKEAAQKKVDLLKDALTEAEPDLGMVESVVRWFGEHIPELIGTITSVLFHPLVGKIITAAGEIAVAEFKRRFGVRNPSVR
ncbi:MAG: CHAT domain-containing protein [Anaerolineae bacterium]